MAPCAGLDAILPDPRRRGEIAGSPASERDVTERKRTEDTVARFWRSPAAQSTLDVDALMRRWSRRRCGFSTRRGLRGLLTAEGRTCQKFSPRPRQSLPRGGHTGAACRVGSLDTGAYVTNVAAAARDDRDIQRRFAIGAALCTPSWTRTRRLSA